MVKGTGCRANAIELRKVTITISQLGPAVGAVFALVDSSTNQVVGWKKKTAGWPDRLKAAIDELRKVLEEAAGAEAFAGVEESQLLKPILDYLKESEGDR